MVFASSFRSIFRNFPHPNRNSRLQAHHYHQ
uniref:Dipeptidyl aminopeptidase 4 isoform X1 n=1 Tax=Rhizophora mucronata TaxID=61149 RepID=A0A2P2L8U4_RHIMU